MVGPVPDVPQVDGAARPRPPRRRRGHGLRSAAHAAALVAVFGTGVGMERFVWDGSGVAGAASSFTDRPEFAVLQEAWDLIHAEYADPGSIDDTALIYGAAEGMVDALGDDGHSRFLDPEDAEDFEEATRGEFTGIGIEIDVPGVRPVVIAPIDGSPADEAGIRAGDTILAVDGQRTDRLERDEIGDLIRGDAGTEVTLTLLHAEEREPYDATMVRRTITLEPVSWRMLPNGIVHLRLAEFSVGAAEGVEQALAAAIEEGASGVILDLRNNPGGLVGEAVGVASQFMPEGTPIFRQQDRGEDATPINTVGTTGLWQQGPLAVLVNGGSASAAEIVGSSLRDNERAPLIGETTYGTGTVLIPFEQPDGSIVLLGTALWLTADGDQIWRQGVEPDPSRTVELPLSVPPSRPSEDANVSPLELATSADRQLRAAYAAVTETPLEVDLPTPPGGE